MRNLFQKIVIASGLLFYSFYVQAQVPKVSFDFTGITLQHAMEQICKYVDMQVSYSQETVNMQTLVSLSVKNADLSVALEKMLSSTNIDFKVEGQEILLFPKQKEKKSSDSPDEKKIKIKGVVIDPGGEPIIGANIQVKGARIATVTNLDGLFSMEVPLNASLQISYIGYQPK